MTTLTQDKYRPKFHFTPPFGWMNDPNGLVYVNDEFHLFYQFHPYSTIWGPMHWGHAISKDLTNWTHLPIALKPDEAGACFSGSAIIDSNNDSQLFTNQSDQPGVIAFYTANKESGDGGPSIQSQHLAYSNDSAKSFNKLSDQPILPNPGLVDFRDPKVFKHPQSDAWIMAVSEGQEIGIYRSTDLINWNKASVFGNNCGAHDEFAWECPDLIPFINTTTNRTYWVLIIGVQKCGPCGGTGTQYFIGDFDGYTFTPLPEISETLWLDLGRDFYATQSWAGLEANSNLAIAWMSNGLYANGLPTNNWRGAMSMPRELSIIETKFGPRIASHIPKVWNRQHEIILSKELSLSSSQVFPLGIEESGVTTIDLKVAVGTTIEYRPFGNDAIIFTFIRNSSGYLVITKRNVFDKNGEDNYSEYFSYENCIELSTSEKIDLIHIADSCSSELLLCNGLYCLTNLVFPDKHEPSTITLLTGNMTINNISFFKP